MINFRYHIVSLTAVFLALAVGIVLGAGPLQNNIAEGLNSTLTQEVSDLRADKSRLNGELATSQRVRSATDEALGEAPARCRLRASERLPGHPDRPADSGGGRRRGNECDPARGGRHRAAARPVRGLARREHE